MASPPIGGGALVGPTLPLIEGCQLGPLFGQGLDGGEWNLWPLGDLGKEILTILARFKSLYFVFEKISLLN